MKGDHLFEEVKPTNNNTTMFAKLHSHPHHPHLHPLHHQQNRVECHTSEEEESRSSGAQTGGGGEIGAKKSKINGGGDGATIEVVRRPRGRPPGSKNKPKPPIIITRDIECAMRPHIFEISSGLDIIDSISRFTRQRNVGLCVLTASGTIVNVSLRQPSTATPGATVTFHGRFDILSISATYLPPSSSSSSSITTSLPSNGCTISLAGPQGQIFGGSVVGSLIAGGAVFIVATSFTSPTYHRLPIEDDDEEDPNANITTTSAACPETQSAPTESSGGGNGMSIYSCHLPSDVVWAPTPRQPPPPSQHF